MGGANMAPEGEAFWIGTYDPDQYENTSQREAIFDKWKDSKPSDVKADIVYSANIAATSRNWKVLVAFDFSCEDGFQKLPGAQACTKCPDWFICSKEAVNMGLQLQKGYYSTLQEPASVWECASEGACPGGAPGTCAPLRVGLTCTECTEGEPADDGTCMACEAAGPSVGLIGVVVFALVVILSIMHVAVNWPITKSSEPTMAGALLCGMAVSAALQFNVYLNMSTGWAAPISYFAGASAFLKLDPGVLDFTCLVGRSDALPAYIFRLSAMPFACLCLTVGAGTLSVLPL